MRDRKKRNIIIGSLCSLLVFMGIGYAILSQTLNISGTANMQGNWSVKITNMELLSDNKTGRAEEVSHSFTDTTATFEANLYMPGDSIEYRVTVENQGNIDALLKSITPTTTNKSSGIKFSHSEIDNTVLTAGKTITFTMKVEFLEDATSIPKVDKLTYNLELVYVQYDGKSEYTPAVETTENSCFMISNDGTIFSYDKSCGSDIVVPAKIDGIPVKRTTSTWLSSNGMGVALLKNDNENEEATATYIFQNEDKYAAFLRQTCEGECDEETKNELKNISYIYGTVEYNSLNFDTSYTLKDLSDASSCKVYTDSNKTIKIESGTSSDYNMVTFGGECDGDALKLATTTESFELLKKYYREKDLGAKYGVSNEYYEYVNGPPIRNDNYALYMTNLGEDTNIINSINFADAIYMESFDGCRNYDENNTPLKSITLPPNIAVITSTVFGMDDDVISVEKVIFPENSKTEVVSYGFKNVKSIENLPSTLKVIGKRAFEGDEGNDDFKPTASVTIPKSVVKIGPYAFNSVLKSLAFEKDSSLITIGTLEDDGFGGGLPAFYGGIISNVTIPKSVKYIAPGAFADNKIENLTFESGSSLKYIGHEAFTYNLISTVTIPSSVEDLGSNNFDKSSGRLLPGAFENNKLTKVTFESGSKLKNIGVRSFSDNQITSINIPNTVEIIEKSAFKNNKITSVNFETNTKLKKIMTSAFANNKIESVTIPKSVELIDGGYHALSDSGGAFENNLIKAITFETGSTIKTLNGFNDNALTSITIPSSVETIGENAFKNNKLTTVTFETGSNVKTIEYDAFENNQLTDSGLSKLPSSLTLLLSSFGGNSNLTQIVLTSPSNVKKSKYDSSVWSDGDKIGVGSDNASKFATIVYER